MASSSDKQSREDPLERQGQEDRFTGPDPGELEIEARWIQSAQEDPAAFDRLFRKYRTRVYRHVLWMVDDPDTASNIADEAFSQALDNIGKFRFKGYSFGAWLFRIARNCVARENQKRKLRGEVPYDPEKDEPAGNDRPDTNFEEKDDTRLLRICLAKLQPECREVITKYYDTGMTTRETALVMDIPESTVKTHLQRGREQLRKLLLEEGMQRDISPRAKKVIRESAIRDDGWKVLGEDDDEEKEMGRTEPGDHDG